MNLNVLGEHLRIKKEVLPHLEALHVADVISILKDLKERHHRITNPTTWIIKMCRLKSMPLPALPRVRTLTRSFMDRIADINENVLSRRKKNVYRPPNQRE